MKRLHLLFVAIIATLVMAAPAQARILRVGPRVGVDISSLTFSKDVFNASNRTGFTAGLQAEINLPLGLSFDGSVMYVRRTIDAVSTNSEFQNIEKSRDYINVPINFKWNLGLPLIGKVFTPYIFTGPDFAFLASKEAINDAWKSHKVDVSWNVGAGVEFFKHLQLSASFGFGITKLSHLAGFTSEVNDAINGRNNNWTVTAAYLF